MIMATEKMCNDQNSMKFINVVMHHTPPPDKVGISFMLAGDDGASITDPYATDNTADNHWIVTGSHIMVFGPPGRELGYIVAADTDPTRPYDVGEYAVRTHHSPDRSARGNDSGIENGNDHGDWQVAARESS